MPGAGNIHSASPTFAQIPLNDGSLYNVTENDVDEFQQLYPGIDCRQEIRNMVGWSMGNPRNRKTKRGIRRFIHSWLSRSQNRAPTQHQDVKKPKTRFDNFESRENNYEAMIWVISKTGGRPVIIRNVAEAKKKIKIGSKVTIMTQKACAKDSFVAIKTGIPRQAIVIGIYTYFVHVQLESGVCESVLWADLINASEEDKR